MYTFLVRTLISLLTRVSVKCDMKGVKLTFGLSVEALFLRADT